MQLFLKTSIFTLAITLLCSCNDKGVNLADLNQAGNQYCDSKARPVSGKAYELVQSQLKQIGGMFDKKVNLYSEGYLINGKKEGAWKSPRGWFLDGKQITAIETINYKDNLAHGPSIVINPNTDDTLSYIEYHRARKHGEYSTYFSNGQHEYKYYYLMDKEHGEQRRYRKDGLLLSKEEYKDGMPHGEHLRANEKTGLLEEIKNYRDGKLQGTFIKYHPNGRKLYKKVYSSGRPFINQWYNKDGSEMPEFDKGLVGKWRSDNYSTDSLEYVIFEFKDKGIIKDHGVSFEGGPLGKTFNKALSDMVASSFHLNENKELIKTYYSKKNDKLIRSYNYFYYFEENYVRTQLVPVASGFYITHLDSTTFITPMIWSKEKRNSAFRRIP